jgi:HAD superfamily hydrolase (TIGR01459 family)
MLGSGDGLSGALYPQGFMSPPPFIPRFAPLAQRYDVVLCDIWGVVHNSIVSSPEACEALARFRDQGGTVVLITNAPRPSADVMRHLDRLHVPRNAYDAVVSSGDVSRGLIAQRPGQTVFHIGPQRDCDLFADLDVRLVAPESADYVVCSGLYDDEVETPDSYRDLLDKLRARNLFMICANPDIVVERGPRLIYCAGALADIYQSHGGEVLYSGKPHRPIYDEALARAAAARGARPPLDRVVAIGDSIRTDLKGAAMLGVDCLFVTAGIHAEEFGSRERPDLEALAKVFAAAGAMPIAVTRQLAW